MNQPIGKKQSRPTTVSLSFAALTIDCADPAALADFWGKAPGRSVSSAQSPGTRRPPFSR